MRRRRAVLAALAAWPAFGTGTLVLAQPVAVPARSPTPRDVEGPFYPVRFPADRDFDLTRIAGHAQAARGIPLLLVGRVVATDGAAWPDVRVELWQCDAFGHYHHVDGDRAADPDFQGYGEVRTDANGRYRFRTIRPVAYGSRPPHLHFKLTHPEAVALTTQLYVRGDGDAGDRVVSAAARRSRELLSIALSTASDEPGALSAEYDFVLVRRS